MNHFIALIICLTNITTIATCQSLPEKKTTKLASTYLEKSNMQRIIAVTVTSVGITAAISNYSNATSLEASVNAIGLGMISTITGSVFYLLSIRNRKKAKAMSTSFNINKVTNLSVKKYESYIPSLSLKITF